MKGQDVLDRARLILHDSEGVRWSDPELLMYVADGQHQTVTLLPESNSKSAMLEIKPDTSRQTLPDDCYRLLRIHRNMGANKDTPGAVVELTDRATMNAMNPDWHRAFGGTEIQHWIYDPEENPKQFYVTPTTNQKIYVEADYSVLPPSTVQAGDTLDLSDNYINALREWVLYLAFMKDADYGGNARRAETHRQAYFNALGLRVETQAMNDPNAEIKGGRRRG